MPLPKPPKSLVNLNVVMLQKDVSKPKIDLVPQLILSASYPNFIRDKSPFINPRVSRSAIASGATKEALDTGPRGENSGRKKEKTEGISCAFKQCD